MNHIVTAGLAAVISCALSGAALAAPITMQTFDTDPVLSSTQAPDVWYTDRYAPAEFESEFFDGDNRLKLGLAASDGATSRPANFSGGFYNTQGRKYDTPGATMMSIDMYIDNSFATDLNRIGGLWATAVDSVSTITAYPIIEFGGGTFNVWDGLTFQTLGLPTGFAYDTFVNIGFSLNTATDLFTYFAGDATISVGANGSQSFSNGIVQGINTNTGINRDIYFDNYVASVAPVPLPAGLPLLLGALAALGIFQRRLRAA